MKICIVSDYLPYIHPIWSGAELVCWKMGELLEKRGHKIIYITTKTNHLDNFKNIFFVKSLFKNTPFIGKNFILDIPAVLSIFSILRKTKPDIVHIQAKLLFFPSAIASLLLGIPYLFTVLDYYILCPRNILLRPNNELCNYNHGIQCKECFSLSERGIIKTLDKLIPSFMKEMLCIIRKYSVDYFMNKAKKIITFSQTSKNRLVNYGYNLDKVEILYHYKFDIPANSCALTYNSDHKRILFVGSLTPHKGLHIIIKAMKEVVKKIPEVKLLVAGKGDKNYVDYINRLVKEYSLEKYIDFLGQKDNYEVLGLIKHVDIVVVPEQWYSEFGPVILIETKLSGKPVVASRIGSIPEFIRDGIDGILVTHNSSEEFANAIINLLRNSEYTKKLEINISENINRITNTDKMLEKLEKIYIDL